MQSKRQQQIIISNQVERMVQNAGMLSGLKLLNICVKMVLTVLISGERKTVQLHTMKIPVTKIQNGLVNQLLGIILRVHCILLCSTNASPCINPHKGNIILLPCQIPTNRRVTKLCMAVLANPFLLPPNGMYT